MRRPYIFQPIDGNRYNSQIWFSMILLRIDNQRADANPEFQRKLEDILENHSPDRNTIRYTDKTSLSAINKEKEKIESQMVNPQRRTPKTHSPNKGKYFYIQTTTTTPKTLKTEILSEYKIIDSRQNY